MLAGRDVHAKKILCFLSVAGGEGPHPSIAERNGNGNLGKHLYCLKTAQVGGQRCRFVLPLI